MHPGVYVCVTLCAPCHWMESLRWNWLLIIALDVCSMWRGDEIIVGAYSREGCERPVPDNTHFYIYTYMIYRLWSLTTNDTIFFKSSSLFKKVAMELSAVCKAWQRHEPPWHDCTDTTLLKSLLLTPLITPSNVVLVAKQRQEAGTPSARLSSFLLESIKDGGLKLCEFALLVFLIDVVVTTIHVISRGTAEWGQPEDTTAYPIRNRYGTVIENYYDLLILFLFFSLEVQLKRLKGIIVWFNISTGCSGFALAAMSQGICIITRR